ncbi:divalent cation tolerance protein CutA [Streptomyces sp. NC-S4]
MPIETTYRHLGQACEGTEYQVAFRTTGDRREVQEKHLVDNHPYDSPEVIAFTIDVGLPSTWTGSPGQPDSPSHAPAARRPGRGAGGGREHPTSIIIRAGSSAAGLRRLSQVGAVPSGGESLLLEARLEDSTSSGALTGTYRTSAIRCRPRLLAVACRWRGAR